LFTQLVEEGINVKLVKLLAYLFANQEMSVLWNVRSNAFTAGNGTKQEGAICLLDIYMGAVVCGC